MKTTLSLPSHLKLLPAHWGVRRLKFSLRERDNRSVSGEEELFSLSKTRGLLPRSEITEKEARAESLQGYKKFVPGDIVMNKMQAWNGVFGWSGDRSGIVSPDYTVLTPEESVHGPYLTYLFQTGTYCTEFLFRSRGMGDAFLRLNTSELGEVLAPITRIKDQIAIAAYLDAETARIDGLIEGKKQLQSLLQELKHSTLTKAIHEGLEPDAPMNDSGVSWFSKLPSHWMPMRLKRVIDGIENGWSPQCEGEPAAPGQWGVLKAGACNGGVFRVEENKALPSNEDPRPELEIKPGNVLMSRASGSLDLVGSVAFVEDVPTGLMLSDKIFRLKIDDEEVCGEWLALALNSSPMRRQIASFVGGAEGLARNIASGNIRELVLPMPPRKEQVEIVHAVKRDLARIAELVHHVDEELEVLKELRSVTITDAVLGRIDVRKTKNN